MAGTRHKLTPFERAYRAGADGFTYLAPGGDEEFFSWSPCGLCGTTLGGNRHDATGIAAHEVQSWPALARVPGGRST